MKTVYELDPTPDLRLKYALRTGEKSVIHYTLPISYLYVNYPDKKTPEQLLREAISEEVKVEKKYRVTKLKIEPIKFDKKTHKLLSKIPTVPQALLHVNIFKNWFHELINNIRDFFSNQVKNRTYLSISIFGYWFFDKIYSYLQVHRFARRKVVHPLYLAKKCVGEQETNEAIERIRGLIHQLKPYTIAKIAEPAIMPLSDVVFGNRFTCTVFYYVFLNEKASDMIGELQRIKSLHYALKSSGFNEKIPFSNEKLNQFADLIHEEGERFYYEEDETVEITEIELWTPPSSNH